jgi:hypothetical protein
MRISLKKRLFVHLYSILVISCTFALVQKKNNVFTVLVWFFVNFARKVSLEIFDKSRPKWMNFFEYNLKFYYTRIFESGSFRPDYLFVLPRKVSRFAPLNRYYIIIDEVFFDNLLVIIYLLACKKNNNSFILVYFKYLFISCTYIKKIS